MFLSGSLILLAKISFFKVNKWNFQFKFLYYQLSYVHMTIYMKLMSQNLVNFKNDIKYVVVSVYYMEYSFKFESISNGEPKIKVFCGSH
jgi:hypothetical protein